MNAKLSLTNEIYVSPQESGFIISDYFVYQGGKSQQLNAKLIYVDAPPSPPIKNSFTRGTGRMEGGGLGAYLTEWLISCNVHVCATKRTRPTLKKTLATSKKFRR